MPGEWQQADLGLGHVTHVALMGAAGRQTDLQPRLQIAVQSLHWQLSLQTLQWMYRRLGGGLGNGSRVANNHQVQKLHFRLGFLPGQQIRV